MSQPVTSITAAAPNRDTNDHLNAVLTIRRHRSRIATRLPPHTASADRSHSYITHMIEDGADPFFVQSQAGHAWGSTTALYTNVGSDYMNNALAGVLERRLADGTGGTR
jgi:site-specific recombinase XerD